MGKWDTDFLVASSTFSSGAASVLDIMGTFPSYNISSSVEEADEKAILNDWSNVGSDLYESIPPHGEQEK